jgi:hypothetical protein
MPRPREMGNLSRDLVRSVGHILADNQTQYIEVTRALQKGDTDEAINILKAIASDNLDAWRVLMMLEANAQNRAHEFLEERTRR